MEENKQNVWKTMGTNLLFLIGFDFALAFIFALIWNTALTWLFPTLPELGYWNAFGLSTIFIFIELIIQHWTKRFIMIRSAKAFEALMVVDKLNYEVAVIQKALKDKGIL